MRWRVSGILMSWKTWFTAFSSPLFFLLFLRVPGGLRLGRRLRLLAPRRRGLDRRLGRRLALVVHEDRLSARGADLLGGGLGELLGLDRERLCQGAIPQDLEAPHVQARQALLEHGAEIDHGAALEGLQGRDVDDGELAAEARVREAALGHAPVDRHLTALVTRATESAGACAPALVSAATGLAQARADAAADPEDVRVLGALLRDALQVHGRFRVFGSLRFRRSRRRAGRPPGPSIGRAHV